MRAGRKRRSADDVSREPETHCFGTSRRPRGAGLATSTDTDRHARAPWKGRAVRLGAGRDTTGCIFVGESWEVESVCRSE